MFERLGKARGGIALRLTVDKTLSTEKGKAALHLRLEREDPHPYVLQVLFMIFLIHTDHIAPARQRARRLVRHT